MNIRTLVILSIGIAIFLYYINKRVYRVESVCYDDDDVSKIVASKGILGRAKTMLAVGETKDGYSLLKNAKGEFVLTLPNTKTKTFQKYSFYEQSKTNPIG